MYRPGGASSPGLIKAREAPGFDTPRWGDTAPAATFWRQPWVKVPAE